ncbi:MAG: rhomboid family intramembrane serine protease [Bacteroidales bacterium]|nr:rhomboid family intramembrane serine protease [Bacteroidales bacterium]MCF8333052.1 rhomboid family intramembrane serine protease [Bacteroidales bacterium]
MMHSYNRSPLDNAAAFFKSNSPLARLILINVIVFVAINIINLFLWLFEIDGQSKISGISIVTEWLSVPSDLGQLFIRPWTLVTYMFLQEGFFHILFNMIILYFGGRIFTEYLSNKKLVKTYIFGGLIGAAFFILAFNIFPVFSDAQSRALALGSSASVLAVLIAIATYIPNYSVMLIFLGRVKLKYIAIFFVVIDVFSIQQGNAGGHIAHLGGAFWGFLYANNLKKGRELGTFFDRIKWPNFSRKSKSSKKSHFEDVYVNSRPMTDEEYNAKKRERQKQIDKILDKISRSGYESLTKEEKEILFRNSNND